MAEGVIEIAPIAYMHGRMLNNAYIVLDEAQNCTYGQLKMRLTRLGRSSSTVGAGDPDQSNLLTRRSGSQDVANRLERLENIEVVRFTRGDVVRHPIGRFRDKVVPGLSSPTAKTVKKLVSAPSRAGNAQIHI